MVFGESLRDSARLSAQLPRFQSRAPVPSRSGFWFFRLYGNAQVDARAFEAEPPELSVGALPTVRFRLTVLATECLLDGIEQMFE